MNTDIKKTARSIKWVTEHTLTTEQRRQLIEEKLKRAEQAYHAQRAIKLKQHEGLTRTF
jgi:hypothetical protein